MYHICSNSETYYNTNIYIDIHLCIIYVVILNGRRWWRYCNTNIYIDIHLCIIYVVILKKFCTNFNLVL